MKNKILLAVAAIVCAFCCVFALAACNNTTETPTHSPSHSHNYQWVDNGNGTHKQHCANDGCDAPDINSGSHVWGADDKCTSCPATKPAEGHSHNYQWVDNGDGTHKQHCANSGCGSPDINNGPHVWGVNDKCASCPAIKPAESHSHNYQWVDNGDGTHKQHCANSGCDTPDINSGSHVWGVNDKCNSCSAVKPAEGHSHNYQWVDNGDGTHKQHCANSGCDTPDINDGTHVWGVNDKCTSCPATKPAEGHSHNYQWVDNGDGTHKQHCANSGCNTPDINSGSHVFSDNVCECGIYKFVYVLNDDNNSYSVVRTNDWTTTEITIPSEYNGKPVTKIAEKAFQYYSLTSITIPDSITEIGDYAFMGNPIVSIVIPDSVKSIGISILGGCDRLTSITIPFVGKNTLFGNRDTQFGYLFGASSALENSQYVPSSLQSVEITGSNVGSSAFRDCTFTNMTVSVSVTNLSSAFYSCTFQNFYFKGSLTEWCEKNEYLGNITSRDIPIYIDGTELEGEIIIPEGTTSIASNAFSKREIVSIEIPGSVNAIGDSAFSDCTSLSNVIIEYGIESIGSSAFFGCTVLSSIVIPDSVTTIGEAAFAECSSLTSIAIPNGVTVIKMYTFIECTSLKEVAIPGVTEIGEYVFKNIADEYCPIEKITMPAFAIDHINPETLTEITITAGESIDSTFFNGIENLTSLSLCESITSLYTTALKNMVNLASITVDENNASYTVIDGVLYNKEETEILVAPKKLSGAVTIPNTITEIPSSAFRGCSLLTEINLPDNLESIKSYAFYGCLKWGTIIIPDSVTSIGNNAFRSCQAVTELRIPEFVTSIGTGAFQNCNRLVNVEIVAPITELPKDIFNQCTYLENITLPESITSIGENAISGTVRLKSITLPSGLKTIGKSAFQYNKLESIYIPEGVTSIGESAFYLSEDLTMVEIPSTVTEIGATAFRLCRSLTSIIFDGTSEQWEAITKGTDWDNGTGEYTVTCTGDTN